MKIFVTGSAGFIGFHLVEQLLEKGHEVVGLDNVSDYYDINLKYGRLRESGIDTDVLKKGVLIDSIRHPQYRFVLEDLENKNFLLELFAAEKFDVAVNLAAQAGVRYSITNPDVYLGTNVQGFYNLLEVCRHYPVKHLVYASSSSIYGSNTNMPFTVHDNVDHPISLYAASKRTNELMAHTYSHLFKIPTTGLRFFTVYGPWGRPDMALFLFTKAIFEGKPISIFNNGEMERDFTYVLDIVAGVMKVIDNPAQPNPEWTGAHPDPASSSAPYRIYNIGNSKPIKLITFIEALEEAIGKKAIREYLPMQAGDVPATWADVEDLKRDMGYQPDTDIKTGVKAFVDWYKQFYNINRLIEVNA